jgi:uncharacterized Ntn-hydrolase superfamily protein
MKLIFVFTLLILSACAALIVLESLEPGAAPPGVPARPGVPAPPEVTTPREVAGSPEAREDVSEQPSTFSIAALDPANGDLGVAVASKFFAVGTVVPWVEAGVGAVATQSYANTSYGPRGLDLLRQGMTPEEAAGKLLESDPEREFRQLGMVDSKGRSHSATGKKCLPWAGGIAGENFCVQGNILVSEATVKAMAKGFQESRGELAERLLAALEAGQRAGGDSRGRQSAALLVARKSGGHGGFNHRYVDLRVDDHPRPIEELRRLLLVQLGKDPLTRLRRQESQGRGEDALKTAAEALKEAPQWDALRWEMARLLLACGRAAEAKQEIDRLTSGPAAQDDSFYRAAQVLAAAGLEEDCLGNLRKALASNPDYAHVIRRDLENPTSPLRLLREKIEALLSPAPPADKAPPAPGPK